MNKYKKACDDELSERIVNSRRKNEQIAKKLIQVYGKFEEYLTAVNGRGVYKSEHESLNAKYQDQIKEIQEPTSGLLKKLRDL